MLCENCQKNKAQMVLSENLNGVKKIKHLCLNCAMEKGYAKDSFFNAEWPNVFQNSLLGNLLGLETEKVTYQSHKYCPNCGQSFQDFKETGLLGCSECYDFFQEELKDIIKRSQRGSFHVGRKPLHLNEVQIEQQEIKKAETEVDLSALVKKQKAAVQAEDYEAAANIRDQIKKIRANRDQFRDRKEET